MERTATVELAFDPDFLLVQLDDFLDDTKPESGVAICALGRMRLMKTLEHQCLLICCDAFAVEASTGRRLTPKKVGRPIGWRKKKTDG